MVQHVFSMNCKSDMLLNNITETFNAWVLEARDMPLLNMMEIMRRMLMNRFHKKRAGIEEASFDIWPCSPSFFLIFPPKTPFLHSSPFLSLWLFSLMFLFFFSLIPPSLHLSPLFAFLVFIFPLPHLSPFTFSKVGDFFPCYGSEGPDVTSLVSKTQSLSLEKKNGWLRRG